MFNISSKLDAFFIAFYYVSIDFISFKKSSWEIKFETNGFYGYYYFFD